MNSPSWQCGLWPSEMRLYKIDKKHRILLVPVAIAGPLLYVCGVAAVSFFVNDRMYLSSVAYLERGSFAAELRATAENMARESAFDCLPRQGHRQHAILEAMQEIDSSDRGRRLASGASRVLDAYNHGRRLSLPLLEDGFSINDEYNRLIEKYEELNRQEIRDYCDEQLLRHRLEEPLLASIEIQAELRSILLESADRFDAAIARYERVRPWLRLVIYFWMAFEIVAFGIAVYVVRAGWRARSG